MESLFPTDKQPTKAREHPTTEIRRPRREPLVYQPGADVCGEAGHSPLKFFELCRDTLVIFSLILNK